MEHTRFASRLQCTEKWEVQPLIGNISILLEPTDFIDTI